MKWVEEMDRNTWRQLEERLNDKEFQLMTKKQRKEVELQLEEKKIASLEKN